MIFSDRFRTTVNVLGDSFGAGIVYHYSKKQLGPLPEVKAPKDRTSSTSTETYNESGEDKKMFDASDAESSESSPLYKHLSSPKKEETDL